MAAPPSAAAPPPELRPFNPDSILARMMNIGKPGTGLTAVMGAEELTDMLLYMKELFASQPMCLEIAAPVNICGDTHGQYGDLMRMFNECGFPPSQNYLFLGDYVDRGKFSVETIIFLFALKIKYPENFFLLRGNHETAIVNKIYGFFEDLKKRWPAQHMALWTLFGDVFTQMPLTAIVGDRIMCMHGGLTPDLLTTTKTLPEVLNDIRRIENPPNPSMPLDLLWADPDAAVKQFKFSIRGVSCTFGVDVVNTVCAKFNIDLVVRAHQVVQDGYEFFANRKLVTVFTAPHYCGQFDNAAAVMVVDTKLKCSFKVLRPLFPATKVKAK